MTGTIYTETVVWSAPAQYANDAPYQLALVDVDGAARTTARILGDRVIIGDRVELAETRDGVPFFRKQIARGTMAT